MAVVQIEDRAYTEPKLKLAAKKHRVSRATILGYAVILWRESQQEGIIEADRETIEAWLDVDRYSKPNKAVEYLITAGYLLRGNKDLRNSETFLISGNQYAVPRSHKRIQRALKAVSAREKKKTKINKISHRSENEISEISHSYPYSITGSEENSGPVDKSTPDVPPEPKGPQVWHAYATAYYAKYKVKPVRNARANSLCAQLVKRLGGDAAVQIATFYLTHQKAIYVSRSHDLSLCVSDAESLHTQWLKGHRVSTAEAGEKDRTQGNIENAREVIKILEDRHGK